MSTQADCERYSREANNTWKGTKHVDGSPRGCYIVLKRKKHDVWFNKNIHSKTSCSSEKCVCKGRNNIF